jgi:hypothetical protein
MRSGDPCSQAACCGHMKTYKTEVLVDINKRIRRLECSVCGNRPENNKWALSLEHAPRMPAHKPRKIRLTQTRLKFK